MNSVLLYNSLSAYASTPLKYSLDTPDRSIHQQIQRQLAKMEDEASEMGFFKLPEHLIKAIIEIQSMDIIVPLAGAPSPQTPITIEKTWHHDSPILQELSTKRRRKQQLFTERFQIPFNFSSKPRSAHSGRYFETTYSIVKLPECPFKGANRDFDGINILRNHRIHCRQ